MKANKEFSEFKGFEVIDKSKPNNITETNSVISDANSPDSGFRGEDLSKLFCGEVKISKKTRRKK